MSLLSDLGTKIGIKLKELTTLVDTKLGKTEKAADSNLLDGLDSSAFSKQTRATSTLTQDQFKRILRVTGDNLSTGVRVHLSGTTGSVVVNVIMDILVNHSGDIHVQTQSSAYTSLNMKLQSTVNEDYDLYAQYTTGTGSTLNLEVVIHPLSNEVAIINPTATAYTGTIQEWSTGSGTVKFIQSAGNVNVSTDGDFYSQDKKVFHEGNSNLSTVGWNMQNAGVYGDLIVNGQSTLNGKVGVNTGSATLGEEFVVNGSALVYGVGGGLGSGEGTLFLGSTSNARYWALRQSASSYDFNIDYYNGTGWQPSLNISRSTGDVTTSKNLLVNGDLKMSGTDSYIWTPGTGTGYTGIWDSANSYASLQHNESTKILDINKLKGSVTIGDTTKAEDNILRMRVDSAHKNLIEMSSQGQGSSEIYMGQSLDYGHGLLYNADDSPADIEGSDWTVLYRKTAGVKSTMLGWHVNDNFVTFRQKPKVNGTNVMLGNKTVSTSTPTGGNDGDIWIQV